MTAATADYPMKTIPVSVPQTPYKIVIGNGLLRDLPDQLVRSGLHDPYLVVSQPRILKALAREIPRRLTVFRIPDGERAKSFSTVNRIIDAMVKNGLSRQSTIVALGGGVVGDVTGFAASIYMRGISLVQVPTTLLAQVDSSIGGKTGINHRVAKNLVGTFYQPRLVLADPSVLTTLPDREYRSGLYESVKYGVIANAQLFELFETDVRPFLDRNLDTIGKLVSLCAAIKAEVVAADEKEGDLRRILNFGHTVGHAIEIAGNYRLKHGEAVGYGMIAAARISTALGRLPDADRARIEKVIGSLGQLPGLAGLKDRSVFSALRHDKKVRDGRVHFVLPRSIGRVEITPDVPFAIVSDVVKELLDERKRAR
jgi:3-dehydroquinate synthase